MAEPEFVRALDRGLAILLAFSAKNPSLTVTDVATATNLSRATARRFLHTLSELGYVHAANGRSFSLTPKILSIGYAYISSLGVGAITTSRIQALAASIREPVTIATLHETDYVVVARADSDRILKVSVSVGASRPAHVSSLGKVLLAYLPEAELDEYFARVTLRQLTERSITDKQRLRAALAEVREQGWAVSDEELEEGLLSVGAPIYRNGNVVAAINTTNHTGRTNIAQMKERVLPYVLETAAAIGRDLAFTT